MKTEIKNLIKIFFELVKIDSPTGEENKVAQYLVDFLKNTVSLVKKDKYGNVYVRLNGKGKPIFFSAHMDTVEPGRGIKPKINNGYITSDETTILAADNKLAISCILATIKRLNEIDNHRPLEIIFTCSEESGNYGALNFDYSLLQAKIGFCFDSATPVGTIITASPFYERFDLKIIGKETHASKPENAINVLNIFSDLLNKIKLGKIDDETIFNIGAISGGFVRNTIPGQLILNGEIRSFSEKKLEKCRNHFIETLKKIIKKHKAKYKVDFVRENSGYKHKSVLMYQYVNTLKQIDLKPVLCNSWGVSDANIFNDKELTCINLGNGAEFTHTTKERVKIKEIEKLTKLMIELIT